MVWIPTNTAGHNTPTYTTQQPTLEADNDGD